MADTSTHAPTETRVGLRRLGLLATGRTGADIERLVREVRRKARRLGRQMTWHDLEESLREDQSKMSDDLRWRTAIHEAGHALAFTLTGVAEVLTVTIGIEGIGQVLTRRYTHLPQTESWLMHYIACRLAGRTAELLIFGEALAGSGGHIDSDLAKATDQAMAAETQLGFSSHQPLIHRSMIGTINELSLDRHLAERVNNRLLAAEKAARDLLVSRKIDLIAIATRLSESGVMTGEEVRGLLGVTEAGSG